MVAHRVPSLLNKPFSYHQSPLNWLVTGSDVAGVAEQQMLVRMGLNLTRPQAQNAFGFVGVDNSKEKK
jgi:hypothetical protein